MSAFGIFTCAVLLAALLVGIAGGVLAIVVNDPALALMAGALTGAPVFLIVGRVWLRSEIEALASEGRARPAAEQQTE